MQKSLVRNRFISLTLSSSGRDSSTSAFPAGTHLSKDAMSDWQQLVSSGTIDNFLGVGSKDWQKMVN